MDSNALKENVAPKPAARALPKKDDFATLAESSGFLVILGFLITGTGLICFIGFHNLLSMYILDAGFILVLFGFGVKVVYIFLKIIGVRR